MKITFTLCSILLSIATFAQDQPVPSRILTFEEAVHIALKNGVRLNQERNNLQLSQNQKIASYAGLAPAIQANASAGRNDGNYFNNNTGTVVNGVNDNVSGSITANLNLFSGFSQINSIRQFSSQLQAQNYFVHRTAQDVINTVSTQYLEVMLDTELLIIAKENFDALNKQLDQVKEQVRLGAKSPVDEYNQEAQTKAAELRMVQAEIKLNNDKALLAQTLLMDAFEQFDVERPNWDINQVGSESLDMEELTKRAKESRGDYMNAAKTADAQRYGMNVALGQSLPSLGAYFRYGSAYNKQHDVPDSVAAGRTIVVADPTSPSGYALGSQQLGYNVANSEVPRPFNEQFRTNNVYKSYGLSLTIPILNGFQNRTAYLQRKTLYQNAVLTKNNLEFQIKNDVVRAVRNYEGARKAYSITSDQLKAADLAFQLETERYNLGVTTFVDFANANRVFVQAQTEKAQAEYRLVFQKIIIEYSVGTLKIENAIEQK